MNAPDDLAPWFAFAGRGWLSSDPDRLRAALRDLREAQAADPSRAGMLDELEASLGGDAGALGRECVRLFLNPDGAPCPPWQSAQGPEPRLMGPPHFSALAWYRTREVEPRLGNEPADHIGLLLTFYAHLLIEGVEGDPLRDFRRDHLAWMPEYCAAVRAEARHPFYRALADYTDSVVERAGGDVP
jgi:TorA maturation chaperone TorD